MSTAQRELEELRRAREAARLQAEEERRQEEEKQKERDKKQAFLNRAAAFQQKKGPSDEEVKAQIQKESQKRTLSRKLNRLLQDEPTQNPYALELNLKGKAHNVKEEYVNNPSDWELIEDPGQRPYYWNRVTKESTYDPPDEAGKLKPPPPPPPRMLMPGAPPPPPPRPQTFQSETIVEETVEEEVTEEVVEQSVEPEAVEAPKSAWVYVCENEPNPYYWNMETNETTFVEPEGYTGAIYRSNDSDQAATSTVAGQVIWSELYTEAGEVYYQNASDGTIAYDRPNGQLIVIVLDEEGKEVNWQEYYENEQVLYMNLTTCEVVSERPYGTVCILQTLE